MGEGASRGRNNGDGSIDVWVGRWRLHFPGGGREPTASDDDPPPQDAGEIPSGVLMDEGDPVTIVSYDGWYARVTASAVDVNRTRARGRVGRIFARLPGRDG